jgi:hypothetical protein
MNALRLAVLFIAIAWAVAVDAHKPSDSYLNIRVDGDRVSGRWDIALRDLDWALGLDVNGDGAITWGEVRTRHSEIAQYALSRLRLREGVDACPVTVDRHAVDHHSDGAYAVLEWTAVCAAPIRMLELDYRLLFDADPQHRGLLRFDAAGETQTAIFSADRPTIKMAAEGRSKTREFLTYLREGVVHIWLGFDHVLFLFALLLPAVLVRQGRRWCAVARFGTAFWTIVKIVTAFTIAHSITLMLAVLKLASLPSRLVESMIALSIIVAVADNLLPVVPTARRWMVAFVFGLVHGFGFANVLLDLGLPSGSLAVALGGFNVGVEVGQLVLVGAFMPIAYALREFSLYTRYVLQGGSAVIAVIACAWLIERSLDLKFMPL